MAPHRLVALTLIATVTPVASAQGPITTSISTEAQRLAAQAGAMSAAAQGATVPSRRNPGLMWAGVGMLAAGVTLALVSFTMEESDCGGGDACVSTAKAPLALTGIGLAGGGAALWGLGGRRAATSPSLLTGPPARRALFFGRSVRF